MSCRGQGLKVRVEKEKNQVAENRRKWNVCVRAL
jgi:hypothetical protein